MVRKISNIDLKLSMLGSFFKGNAEEYIKISVVNAEIMDFIHILLKEKYTCIQDIRYWGTDEFTIECFPAERLSTKDISDIEDLCGVRLYGLEDYDYFFTFDIGKNYHANTNGRDRKDYLEDIDKINSLVYGDMV